MTKVAKIAEFARDRGGVLELLLKALPHADQICDIKMPDGQDSIQFVWRGQALKVDYGTGLAVSSVASNLESSNNVAILIETLLRRRLWELQNAK